MTFGPHKFKSNVPGASLEYDINIRIPIYDVVIEIKYLDIYI